MKKQRVQGGRNVATTSEGGQGASNRDALLDKMRDQVGAYPAHADLEGTEDGQAVLDVLARLQLAYADAIRGNSSKLADEGFREPDQLRKQMCGNTQPTLADIAVVAAALPKEFKQLVGDFAVIAGGSFAPVEKSGRTLRSAIADIQRVNGELTARYVEAAADGVITPDEARDIAKFADEMLSLGSSLKHILKGKGAK